MGLLDTTSIGGGYGQVLPDWQNGDGRQFTGSVLSPPLVSGDVSCTDAYFTLKSSPTLPDSSAIIQKHITIVPGPAGLITYISAGGHVIQSNFVFNIYSADYEGLVSSGPVYYWDFRVVTTGGQVLTLATGTVVFSQNVTQTNNAGTPASFPNNGNPRFRGFLPTHPINIANFSGIFNAGDFFRNSNPVPGGPAGWVAINACVDATGFRTDGVVGNT